MQEILRTLSSLPSFAIYALVGAVSGVIGVLIAYVIEKLFNSKKLSKIIPVIFIVISTQVSQKVIVPAIYQSAGPANAVDAMKGSRLFAAIFKYHPGSEQEATDRFQKILSGDRASVFASSRALGAELTSRYFDADVLNASDAAIFRVLQVALKMIVDLRDKPDACVATYLGTPNAKVEDISSALANEQLEAKAEVIESAFASPQAPPKGLTVEQLVTFLTAAYRKNNLQPDELSNIGDVGTLPAAQGCNIAFHFLTVMTSLGPKDASTVYKALVLASKS
jgi:hypothetical protein